MCAEIGCLDIHLSKILVPTLEITDDTCEASSSFGERD